MKPASPAPPARSLLVLLACLPLLWAVPVAAQRAAVVQSTAPNLAATVAPTAAPTSAPGARVIVGFKPGATALRQHGMLASHSRADVATLAQRRADGFAQHVGARLVAGRVLNQRMQVVMAAGLDSATLARRLAQHGDVAYAVVDQRRRVAAVPNDPLFSAGPSSGRGPDSGQWYLRAPAGPIRSAINAQAAWETVTGNSSVAVAVLDSGVLGDHIDLVGRVLPGFDAINDRATANDGNGRDSDASDPGDWVTVAEDAARNGAFYQCGAEDSSWHGTQVAGIIGANGNNGLGMAGTAYGVRILPVRVLGKCGGYDSDIMAGMLWAAGIDQPGLSGSSTPARVLNMSLGGDGTCSQAYIDTMASVTARNVVVVAAAGNSTGHATGVPANCPGVVAVAGLRHAGSKVGFSDLGADITISAPGGNCINIGAGEPCLYPIVATSNSGTRSPVPGGSIWTDAYKSSVGTSFSSPIVAGTVALMLSAKPQLTAPEIIAILKRSARPFPTNGADNGTDPAPVPVCRLPDGTDQLQCYCTTSVCGAGMLDAAAAVQATLAPDSLAEAARQLMDFGERHFPEYFPDRPVTQSAAPFIYRYYASTGIHLGVVVQPDATFVMNGVYGLGGPFGNVPHYVGLVRDFITPFSSTAPVAPSALAGLAQARLAAMGAAIAGPPKARPLPPPAALR